MYKISNITILYSFLFLMLFVGIISNKFGVVAYGLVVLFVIAFVFFNIKVNQVNYSILFVLFFGLSILFFSYIYQIFQYDYNNIYYIQFFGSQLLFFFIFGFFIQIQYFTEKYIAKFLSISLIVMGFIIVIDYILIYFGLHNFQLMYRPELEFTSYLTKPLGVFAQFSVNSSYAVVFYLLYLSFHKQRHIFKTFLFFIVMLIVVLQDSGTGYISFFLLLSVFLFKYKINRYTLFPLFSFMFLFIILSNVIPKVSFDYLYFLYEYFKEIINISYIQNINSIGDVLFGINGNYHFSIDFGPLFMIAKVGLFYFIFYIMLIFYLIFKAPDRYFKMAIFILLIGNMHYPTLFYPIMNVLLPVLFLYVINIKNKLKLNHEEYK